MKLIRRHRYALALAFFVGTITCAPTVLAPFALSGSYHGVQYLPLDDEDIYRARIHEVLDGHFMVASPFLYEYKNASTPVAPLNEWVYALPAAVIGLSVTIVLSKFLFPALLFFLVYLLVRRMLGSEESDAELTAIVAGFLVVLGAEFVDYGYMLSLLHATPPRPILWTRIVNPIMGALELFCFLLLLHTIWERKSRWAWSAAGVLLAAMVGYYFSFGMGIAALSALSLVALVSKRFDVLKQYIYAGTLSVVLDAPWWYSTLHSVGGAAGRALAERNGMFFTHTPVINKALLAATLIVILLALISRFAWRRFEHTSAWLFSTALLIACWIAFNEQLITGREIWYQHFAQYTVPLSVVAVLAAGYATFARWSPRAWRACMFLLGVFCIVYGIYSITSYESGVDDLARIQSYAPIFSYLNTHAVPDCVVLTYESNDELDRLIPAYTSCNVYTTTYEFFGIPQERIDHNFLLRLRLAGIAPGNVRSYLLAHSQLIRDHYFSNWDELFGSGLEPWIVARIDILTQQYQAFASSDLLGEIRSYRVDYLVADAPVAPVQERELGLKAEQHIGDFYLYQF